MVKKSPQQARSPHGGGAGAGADRGGGALATSAPRTIDIAVTASDHPPLSSPPHLKPDRSSKLLMSGVIVDVAGLDPSVIAIAGDRVHRQGSKRGARRTASSSNFTVGPSAASLGVSSSSSSSGHPSPDRSPRTTASSGTRRRSTTAGAASYLLADRTNDRPLVLKERGGPMAVNTPPSTPLFLPPPPPMQRRSIGEEEINDLLELMDGFGAPSPARRSPRKSPDIHGGKASGGWPFPTMATSNSGSSNSSNHDMPTGTITILKHPSALTDTMSSTGSAQTALSSMSASSRQSSVSNVANGVVGTPVFPVQANSLPRSGRQPKDPPYQPPDDPPGPPDGPSSNKKLSFLSRAQHPWPRLARRMMSFSHEPRQPIPPASITIGRGTSITSAEPLESARSTSGTLPSSPRSASMEAKKLLNRRTNASSSVVSSIATSTRLSSSTLSSPMASPILPPSGLTTPPQRPASIASSLRSSDSKRRRRMNISSVSSIASLLSIVMDEEAAGERGAEGDTGKRRSARPRSLLLDQQIEALSGYIHELYTEFTSDETAATATAATAARSCGAGGAKGEESALAEVLSPADGVVADDDDEDSDAEAEVDYLSSIFPNWTVGRLLGSGTSGMVFEAVHPSTMKPLFAIKKERIVNSHPWLPMPTLFSTIVKVLRLADHPNLMKFYGVENVGDEMYIFMEFCKGGSLGDVIYHKGREDEGLKPGIRDEKLVKKWIRMTLEGLRYCHRHNIVHRDLKPGNLLIAEDGTLKIGDFGGAKVHQTCCDHSHLTQMFGSPSYMAPEIITSSAEGPKGAQDLWSLGCCLFEMVLGKPPWYQLDNVFALYYLMGSWAKRAEALQTEVGGGLKRGGCEKHAGAYAEQAARMEGRWGVETFGGVSVWGRKVGGGDDEEDEEEMEDERIRDSDLTDSDFSDESDSEVEEEEERRSVKSREWVDRPSSVATTDGVASKRGSAVSIKSRVASAKNLSLSVLVEDWDAEGDEGDEGLFELAMSLQASFEDEGYEDDDGLNMDDPEVEGYKMTEDDGFEGDADPNMSAFYLSRVDSGSSLERLGDNSGDTGGSSQPTSPCDELDRVLESRRKMRKDNKRGTLEADGASAAAVASKDNDRPPSVLSSVTNSTTSKTTRSNLSTVSSCPPTPSRAGEPASSGHDARSSSHYHHRHRRHYRKRPSLAMTQALPKPIHVPGGKGAKREREAILESAGTSGCMLSAQDCLMRSQALSNPLMTIALESGLFGYEALDFLNLCLQWDPENRPSAEDLLEHPFVADA